MGRADAFSFVILDASDIRLSQPLGGFSMSIGAEVRPRVATVAADG